MMFHEYLVTLHRNLSYPTQSMMTKYFKQLLAITALFLTGLTGHATDYYDYEGIRYIVTKHLDYPLSVPYL